MLYHYICSICYITQCIVFTKWETICNLYSLCEWLELMYKLITINYISFEFRKVNEKWSEVKKSLKQYKKTPSKENLDISIDFTIYLSIEWFGSSTGVAWTLKYHLVENYTKFHTKPNSEHEILCQFWCSRSGL